MTYRRKNKNTTQGIWGWTITHTPTKTSAFSMNDFNEIADYFTAVGTKHKDARVWYKGKEMTMKEFCDICHKK